MSQLNDCKLLLGITDNSKDELLALLISSATADAQNITHLEFVERIEGTINEMVIYKYNRLGSEGLQSESFGGVNFNYENDYPESIMKSLRANRVLRCF